MADKVSTIGKAYVQILPSMDGITAQMNSLLGNEMQSAGKTAGSLLGGAMSGSLMSVLSGIGSKITDVMSTAVTELTSFVSDSVNVGMDFDSAMSQISATMGMTAADITNNVKGAGDTFNMLREKAKEMGAETNFSATQAAEGLNILAMSGYKAEESVDMIGDVLHLAAAGGMDMATAAADISGAMKGFNDETKNSAYYADLMAKGATLANTNVTQLGEALSGAAAQGAAYKQDAESMTLALLRLAEQGETGANASTMLAAAMKNLYTPTDTAAKAMAELGVSAYDESGNFKDINDVVNELNKSLGKYSDEQQAAYINTIFGIQGQEAYNKMIVTSTEKQKEWAAALSDSSGEAAKQYDTMTDNLQGDIDKWNSALEGFKIEISDSVMPTVRDFVQLGTDGLSKVTNAFNENGIEGAVGAFGDLFGELLDKANELLPDVLNVLVTLSESLVTGFVNALPDIVNAVTGAIPQLSAALAKIGDALVKNAPLLTDSLGQLFTAVMTSAFEMLPGLASGLGEMLVALVNAAAAYIPQIVQAIGEVLPQLSAALVGNLPVLLDALGELLSAVIDSLPELLSGLIGAASVIAETIIGALPDVLQTVVEALPELLTALLDALPLIADAVNNVLLKLGEMLPEILPVLLPALTECITTIITSLASFITNNVTELLNTVINVANTLTETLIDNIDLFTDCVWEIVCAVGQAIYDNLPELTEKLTETILKLIDSIPALYGRLIEAGSDLIMKIAEGFGSEEFQKAVTEWGDSVLETLDGIWSDFKDFWGGLGDSIVDIGGDIIGGIVEGIKQGWEDLKSDVTEFGDTVVETFCDIFDINSPSKVMEDKIGINLAKGIGVGFGEEIDKVSELISREAEDSLTGALTDITSDVLEPMITPTVDYSRIRGGGQPVVSYTDTELGKAPETRSSPTAATAPTVLQFVLNSRTFAEATIDDFNDLLGAQTVFDMGGYAR